MIAGRTYAVSVTMKNTGTTTWTAAENYRLGSQNPQDNWNWGIGRVYLSAGESISPGQSKTFSFNVVPNSFGTVNFQWRMLREGVEWFGDYSANVPVSVRFEENNSGHVTISSGNFYLNGKKWFPYGMNYWPSHFSHIIEPNRYESWYMSPYYEDNLAMMEKDLSKMQDLGFNSIWITAYASYPTAGVSSNFADFLQRIENHNLKAGVSLYGCNPFISGHRTMCHSIIESLHNMGVTEKDTIFAYDLAWEVTAGQYSARNALNREWTKWVIDRYGSIGAAEAAWVHTLERICGERDSIVLSHNIPTRMIAGKTYNVQITFKNTGTYSWTEPNMYYRLGATQQSELFAGGRQYMSGSEVVATGQSKTFSFQMKAPPTPGTYSVGWRMLQENVAWFGEELSWQVVVGTDELQTMVEYSPDIVCGPTDTELCNDGAATKMVAAYRRFIDDYANREFAYMIRDIRSYDTRHLITVRMGYGGNGNPGVCPEFPLDIRTSTNYLDFVTYESWGYSASDLRKTGFAANYGNTGKPVVNIEFGICGCYAGTDCANCAGTILSGQSDYYQSFYEMAKESGTKGSFGWWFKGIRPAERSDYGVVQDNFNLDEKPVTTVIRNYAVSMRDLPDRTPNYWITADRDAHAGEWQMYSLGMTEYLNALNSGKTPGVKTPCTGKTSLDKIYLDGGLPKCLGSLFDSLELKDFSGNYVKVSDNDVIAVNANTPLYARASVRNTGEAKWLGYRSSGGGNGTVRLGGNENYGMSFRIDIDGDVPWQQSYEFVTFKYSDGINKPANVTFQMVSEWVAWFGDKVDIRLVPVTTTTTTTSTTTTGVSTTTTSTSSTSSTSTSSTSSTISTTTSTTTAPTTTTSTTVMTTSTTSSTTSSSTSSTTTLPECISTPNTHLTLGINAVTFQTPHSYSSNMDCYSGVYTCPPDYQAKIHVKYDTETWYDYLYVYENASEKAAAYSGNSSGYIWLDSGYESVLFRFTSDQSINRWGVDVDYIECYATQTTTTSTTTTTTTSSTSTSSTTLAEECLMPGNKPPCQEISISEVVDSINRWAAGNLTLGAVIDLINSWADPQTYPSS